MEATTLDLLPQPAANDQEDPVTGEIKNKIPWLMIALGAIGILIILFFGPFPSPKSLDVAIGVPAVSDVHREVARQITNELRALPEAERSGYSVNQRYPGLAASIIAQMRDRGKIRPNQRVERIDWRFGSMEGVVAEQAGGRTAWGHFNDQLLAVVKIAGVAKPWVVIVLCTNGMIEFPEDRLNGLSHVGQQTAQNMSFTLRPGEGIATYTSFQTAISFAEICNRRLTKVVPGKRAEVITPAEARRLESQTNRLRVVAAASPGDQFNVADMTCLPAPR